MVRSRIEQLRAGATFGAAALLVLAWINTASALDVASARAGIEARMSAVGACLASAGDVTHGGVVFTLTLHSSGMVDQVDVTSRGPSVPRELARCAATALAQATFEPPGRAAIVTVRLHFSDPGASGDRVRIGDVMVHVGLGLAGTTGSDHGR